ncbi:retrovirus-related pol polyprotein from transposon TNT 1-94 [Tanacetum coccineum]
MPICLGAMWVWGKLVVRVSFGTLAHLALECDIMIQIKSLVVIKVLGVLAGNGIVELAFGFGIGPLCYKRDLALYKSGAEPGLLGITHNFSAPRTPQSNGVVERKNRTLQEMSRTMLNEQSIPQKFWCNAVDTSTYILNRILIRPILGKTPYEIFRGRKPSLEYFKVFGSKCFILNTKDHLTKFDPKSYEGVFLGYSQNSKAYVVLNKHTMKVEESLNVTFDESPPPTKLSPLVDDDVGEEEAIRKNTKIVNTNNEEDESIEVEEIVNIKESKNHPLDQVIGNLNQRTLRSQAQNHSNFFCLYL